MKTMKKLSGILISLFLMVGLACSFVSCSNDDDGSDTTPEVVNYSISFEEDTSALSVNVDESITLTVKEKTGTWKISTDETSGSLKVEETATGYKITGVSADANAKLKLYPVEAGDETKYDVELTINVVQPYYTLNLTLNDAVAAKAASIKVTYGHKSTSTETVDAIYTAGEKTAKAKLKKALAGYEFFENIKVVVTDANGAEVKTELASTAGDKADNYGAGWFKYTAEGFTGFTVSAYVEQTMTLTLNFPESSGITSVKVQYYSADISKSDLKDTDGKTETVTVTSNTATLTLSKEYASSWGYNANITAYAGETDVTSKITGLTSTDTTFGGDCSKIYFAFVANGTTTVTVAYSAEEYKELFSKEYTLTGDPVLIFTKADVKGYTFTALKFKVTGVAAQSNWVTLTAGAAWAGETKLETKTKDGDTYTFTGAVAESNLASYASDGIGIAGTEGTVTVKAYYIGTFDEAKHNETEAATAEKTLVENKAITLASEWTYPTIIDKSEFANMTVKKIDATLTLAGTLASGNIAVGGSTWGKNFTWPSGEETAFTISIDSSTTIADIVANGFGIGGDYAGNATLTVKVTYEVTN